MKIFESVLGKKVRYSAFDLSHEQKLSFNMGELIPTLFMEVLPGDEFKVTSEMLLRFQPMKFPMMHRVDVYMHYFYVPNRIIWNEWENFITGGQDGTSAPVHPTFTVTQLRVGGSATQRLANYLGIPTQQMTADSSFSVSALPFRAYQQIYNDYFRDETLDPEINVETAGTGNLTLRTRRWEKDYFTSALPWTQRGTAQNVPLNLSYAQPSVVRPHTPPDTGDLAYNNLGQLIKKADGTLLRIENLVSTALNFTINELRRVSAVQRFMERQARGGYRYIETLKSQFGVHNNDLRLQRPQYLGGGKQPVTVSEVLNTTATNPAAMAGHGVSTGTVNTFKERFTEHGYVFGIMSVLPKTAYAQGVPTTFRRFNKYDYFWPEFEDLGEQEVRMTELFYPTGTPPANFDTEIFGYQQRYADYKYMQDGIYGDFQTTLADWHMGRIFAAKPGLNSTFLEATEITRPFAVATGQKMLCQLYHTVHARRPMPYFSNPTLE